MIAAVPTATHVVPFQVTSLRIDLAGYVLAWVHWVPSVLERMVPASPTVYQIREPGIQVMKWRFCLVPLVSWFHVRPVASTLWRMSPWFPVMIQLLPSQAMLLSCVVLPMDARIQWVES